MHPHAHQGLADTFILLGMPFDSPEAAELNSQIFEVVYYAALSASCELAERDGTYETYAGSPVSQGILQPDMWGVKPSGVSGRWVVGWVIGEVLTVVVRRLQAHAPLPWCLVVPFPA